MFKIFLKVSGIMFLFFPVNTYGLELCANKNNKIGTDFKYKEKK